MQQGYIVLQNYPSLSLILVTYINIEFPHSLDIIMGTAEQTLHNFSHKTSDHPYNRNSILLIIYTLSDQLIEVFLN